MPATATAVTTTTSTAAITTTATASAAATFRPAAESTAPTPGLRASFIDCNRTSVHFLTVQRANRRLRFLIAAHFDEAEPFGAASIAIDNDLRRLHCAMGAELLL